MVVRRWVGRGGTVGWGVGLLWGGRGTAAVPVGPGTAESLARQIAVLDRAFEQGPRTPEAEAAYRARREQLKQRLRAALATRPAGGEVPRSSPPKL